MEDLRQLTIICISKLGHSTTKLLEDVMSRLVWRHSESEEDKPDPLIPAGRLTFIY